MSRSGIAVRAGGLLAALTLLAAACGGGSKSPGGGGGGTSPSTPANLTPKAGGSLTIATEAEVTSGFDPFNSDWDATGISYASTVYDPLMALAADGTFKPYLAQSMTPNADSSVWTITARAGIKFTDGEPFNADAMVLDFKSLLASPLTGPVLRNIGSVAKVDDMSIAVTMKPKGACPTCGPWVFFPGYMASQLGYMVAPKAIADKNRAQNPIGTGPFMLKEWVPSDHMTAVKNPNYWRKDASGNQLPYLDSVTFKPIIDPQSRKNSLLSGTIDVMHSTDTQTVVDFRQNKSVHLLEQNTGRTELDFVMLNVTSPPLDDIRIRQALAMATDQVRYNAIVNNGIQKPVKGPYSDDFGIPNAPGYPNYDPAGAKKLVQQYEADHHTNKVEFEFGTTNTAKNLQTNNLLADMWSQVGITAHVVQIEQSSYISNAVFGKYQAYGWRQFGEPIVDGDVTWWSSENANPPLATNFARNKDPQLDAALRDARETTDPARQKADYVTVSAQLNKDIPFIWLSQVLWIYAAKPNVQGLDHRTMPDGSAGQSQLSGVIVPTQLWVN